MESIGQHIFFFKEREREREKREVAKDSKTNENGENKYASTPSLLQWGTATLPKVDGVSPLPLL